MHIRISFEANKGQINTKQGFDSEILEKIWVRDKLKKKYKKSKLHMDFHMFKNAKKTC